MSYKNRRDWIVAIPYIFPGPVGTWINEYHKLEFERIANQIKKQKAREGIPDEELVLEEHPELKTLDPNLWKEQDHYAVLGLPKLRHRATQDQIKYAYRKAVLKHHPDKRRRKGEEIQEEEDDDYFTCITKAYEILGNFNSRRAYDSVDPTFDDDIPPKNLRGDFFEVYSEVFERNSRWSVDTNVPLLGDKYSTIEEVDKFYNFWYNFNSWREYSYLDEENKEKAEDAYERRWMEKQNRAARAARKKEENQRVRQLVDNAYASDPRIKLFKEQEKKRKEEAKKEKAEAIKKAREEQLAEEKRQQKIREEEEKKQAAAEKKKQAEAKKSKEREKKMLKSERQKLETFCEEENYFNKKGSQRFDFIDKIHHLCLDSSLSQIQELNSAITTTPAEGQKLVEQAISKLEKKIEAEKKQHLSSGSAKMQNGDRNIKDEKNWPYEDLQLLIKAVNLFPAGTANRWQVVATYINTHSSGKTRTSKECLARAKNFKESDLKAEVNEKAFEKFQEKHSVVNNKATPSDGSISTRHDGSRPWTGDEQKKLEQALKTFPASTEQRWDKIAGAVDGRTKKECMLRYKELVEMVKAKKAVNQAAKKT